MKMIVGLGNPGRKYEKTKHNVGFRTVEQIAANHHVVFKKNIFEAEVAELFVDGEKVLLVKPQTFMNESGRAVGPLMTYYGILPEELVVIYDDLDLTLGKVRLRQKGSAGGHNGMKSIIAHLKTDAFKRIKIGIGRPKPGMTVVNYVLHPFDKEDEITILESIDQAATACEVYLEKQDFIMVMNTFN